MAAKFGVFVDENHEKLPTLCQLPKVHKKNHILMILLARALLQTRLYFNLLPLYIKILCKRSWDELKNIMKNGAFGLSNIQVRLYKSFLASSVPAYDFSTLFRLCHFSNLGPTWLRILSITRQIKYCTRHIIIRIYHEFEGRIEKSIPRIAHLASWGLPSDDKRWSQGTDFSILPSH